ncbi:thrombospondin type 1 domain protein [Teladorsagia circumcincta]|uniref:Thrombospondin type 1 domain protein n=1 Tax=Teladorsagia circumcincta TaxID=45464 RepID=A0A2G9V5F0_TELCI|nr:thrombospondin type 1 domain protein [Teladorsagia circumcincta]
MNPLWAVRLDTSLYDVEVDFESHVSLDMMKGTNFIATEAAMHRHRKAATLHASETTDEPSWAPTGKLNQFRGFATPRPLPPNADFIYASVWGGWSAWSFCSNGVRIRVRACNTVRGFSCLGPNQEFVPCEHNLFPPTNRANVPTDYDVVDPYEADRREAMKQLYPDDVASSESSKTPPPEPARPVPNFVKIPKSDGREFRRMLAAQPIQSIQEPIELDRALKELLSEKPRTSESAPVHRLSSEQLQLQQEELDAA